MIAIDSELAFSSKDYQTFSITRKDAIYDKTIHPIPNGGMIRGWLVFVVDNLTFSDAKKPNNKIEIQFSDIVGKKIIAKHAVGIDTSGPPKYLPDGSGGLNFVK